MAFKGEIPAAILAGKKTGFATGDIYRIISEGKLGDLDVQYGTFVEWKGTGWAVRSDIQLATTIDMQSLEEHILARETIPSSTLRFSFGDLAYDPTTDTTVASRHNTADRAGGGTPAGYGGTWTKLRTKYTNIWDYTYVDDTLLNEFDNGNYAYEATPATRFWNDVEHNPIKIIASNTAGCESFKRAFQGCWAITEIWELDASDALNMQLAFSYCKNLRNICKLDCSSCKDISAMFQYCFKIDNVELTLIDDDSVSNTAQSLFMACDSLTTIKGVLNFKSVTNAQAAFSGCQKLNDFVIENTGRVTNMAYMFAACFNLSMDFINSIDTSAATNIRDIVDGYLGLASGGHMLIEIDGTMKNITEVPTLDFSNVTNARAAFAGCDIKAIDATKLASLSGSVDVRQMFDANRNCKSGILDAYAVLDAVDSSHTNCFRYCGIDTDEGRAELEQIPASWGGLAP